MRALPGLLAALALSLAGCKDDPHCRGPGGGPPSPEKAHGCVMRELKKAGAGSVKDDLVRPIPSPAPLPDLQTFGILSDARWPDPSAYCFVHVAGVSCSIVTSDKEAFQALVSAYHLGAKPEQLTDDQWIALSKMVLRMSSIYGDPKVDAAKVFALVPADVMKKAHPPAIDRPASGGVHLEVIQARGRDYERTEITVDRADRARVDDWVFYDPHITL
jgi:hypothetical protein